MASPPFGVVPAGHPLVTEPSSVVSETSFLYHLSRPRPFSHITVFLLPGVALPPDTATAIYLGTADDVQAAAASGAAPNFRFLGGIGPGKESAVFKVSGGGSGGNQNGLVLGISVEPAAAVAARMQELLSSSSSSPSSSAVSDTAVVGPGAQLSAATIGADRLALAQKIIQNAFTFLASFSGTAGPGQVEVVPLKAFEEWWKKFEGRIRSDPTFLDQPPS